jgi:hypothetical protein
MDSLISIFAVALPLLATLVMVSHDNMMPRIKSVLAAAMALFTIFAGAALGFRFVGSMGNVALLAIGYTSG